MLLSNLVYAYGCGDKVTPWNDDGGGNTVYLDRHRVSCGEPGNVINRFKLERARGNKIRYRYTCCKLEGNACVTRGINNAFTSGGNGDLIYLDRQKVECENGVLNEFKLYRKGYSSSYKYGYKCCDLDSSRLSCQKSSTRETDEGTRQNYYLDRQTVACSEGQFLQSFKLQRTNNRRIRYNITCCRVTR
ncbi:unnamed protein product [Mytilus edulis]|uniref:Uncharacterized protein n=1 Tax=Mytilus edulis TaxID=6550 RepID=A0A8S3QJH0_MYTED|nr:unnamed protein product [Mytilus edulis]